MAIDHTQAINNHAVERYLLGEMPPDEAEDFEAHYFECQECAVAVDDGDIFIANAKAVFSEPEPHSATSRQARQSVRESLRAWWSRPSFLLPAAAAILMAVAVVYQAAVVIPSLRQTSQEARVLPAFELAGATRGEPLKMELSPGAPSFALSIDVPPDVHFSRYECVLSSGDRTLFRVTSPAPASGLPITILVPARNLKAVSYQLDVYGVTPQGQRSDRVSRGVFDLQLK